MSIPADDRQISRDFKGIWIPREIWLNKDLNHLEKCLWAEIDSLDREVEGCTASNKYFCSFFGVKERTLQDSLSRLKKLGLIKQVAFDGRTRTLRSSLKTTYEKFSTPEVRKSAPLQCGNPHPSSLYIENKEENKEISSASDETDATELQKSVSKKKEKFISVAEGVSLTQKQIEGLRTKCSGDESFYQAVLKKYSDWKKKSGQTRKSDYLAIINWTIDAVKNERVKEENKQKYQEKNIKELEGLRSYLEHKGARGNLKWSKERDVVFDSVHKKEIGLSQENTLKVVGGWYSLMWED